MTFHIVVNKTNDDCKIYRETFDQDFTFVNKINLRDCHEKNDALYYNDRLWMLVDVLLLVDFLKEIHEFSTSNHSEFNRMKNLLRRNYYWFNMRKIVRRYVRNCHECQRIKIFKDRKNDLFILLIISLQRWIDISIDFITRLFDVHDHNFIYTIIDRLSKKRHYAFCTTKDESTNVEVTTKIFIQYVFRIHDLLFFIIFDRDSQFISFVR